MTGMSSHNWFLDYGFFLNLYALPFLVASVFVLLMGFFVFSYGGFEMQRFVFLIICLNFFLWLGGTFFAYSINNAAHMRPFMYVTYAGVSLIPACLIWYAAVWLHEARRYRVGIIAAFALGLFLTCLIVRTGWIVSGTQQYFWGFHSRLTPAGGTAYLIYFVTFMAFFFYLLYKGYQEQKSLFVRRQIKLVAIAFAIANLGTSDFLPCYGIEVFPLGGLFMFGASLALGYTIVRHRLFDIETAIHQTILWFLTASIAILPFAALIYGTSSAMAVEPPAVKTAWYLLLMLGFYCYFRVIQPQLSRFFRRKSGNLDRAFNEFSGELVRLQNIRELLKRFVRVLRRSLYVKQLAVYLWDEKSSRYVPALAKGFRRLEAVSPGHPLLDWMEKKNLVAVSGLAESFPENDEKRAEIIDYFGDRDVQIAVPFVLGGKMIGFLHLGKKENLRKFTAAEIYFLSKMKAPVTIALSNSRQLEDVSRLYKQVQHQNERLQELDRLKSQFLANTSHELRTPLNGMLGLVESIIDGADGAVNELQQKHLRMIIESGTSLKELINNLLELSRIESGEDRFDMRAFNVMNVIDPVISLTENLARKKGLSLRTAVPSGLPDCSGDPQKIQRVMMNLVGNAIKFTEAGSITIRVSEKADSLEIAVEDTGIGISRENQEIIFERFRQVDGSMTRKFEGTGLGLSIAREIVRRHGSELGLESEPGRGSRFYFSLPKTSAVLSSGKEAPKPAEESLREEEATVLRHADPAAARAEDLEIMKGNGERILVIDDNEINREVVRTRLEMHNYTVTEAADGLEGLKMIESGPPDLVILDLMMPRMSGYEFCKKVRDRYPANEMPIIMLTAKTDMGDRVYGLQIGANDYISKPFHKDELITRVGILLKIRAMTKELKAWNEKLEKRVEERTEQLIETQNQLIQAEKLATIGTLAGGIAHEINNPLTAVLTNAQLLKMTAPSDDRETLELIEEGAKRCQVIVQKLLKYSRKTSTQKMEPIDLNQVIQSTISMLAYQFQQENVTLDAGLEPLAPVLGISNEIEQVITNLLVNARDAVKPFIARGAIVHVRTRMLTDGVEVIVKDNGVGIPKENLGKIFDPFFTTKEVGSGTGLGLAVSYSILEKHGCDIRVQSEIGKGSVFTLKFPLMRESAAMKADIRES